MKTIEDYANTHLGKASDGSTVQPYITPDFVDASLLVGIPRFLNRVEYGIVEENLPFVGYDAWNSYEFSTLLDNGFPLSGWLKFTYPANSPNIVESKSVKLYLNSYNMAKLINSVNDIDVVTQAIESDLRATVGAHVKVHIAIGATNETRPLLLKHTSLEDICNVEKISFDQYNENIDILEVTDHDNSLIVWKSHSLRSNCRVTNQPDWGDVFIHIKGLKKVTPESLLQYIISMRKENHFHEEVCECIYKRLWDLLSPEELIVTCLYTRRGGIDINPCRMSNENLAEYTPIILAENFCAKTMRQ